MVHVRDDLGDWRWAIMPPALQELARQELEREILGQDRDAMTAALLSRVLSTLDVSPLACSTEYVARRLGVSPSRVRDLRDAGMLPYMVELRGKSGNLTQPRAFWRCIADAWGDYRNEHPKPMGRGARWWPPINEPDADAR